MYSGELLKIKNSTGSAVTYSGTEYQDGEYVPLGRFASYEVQFPKLWSADSGRAMNGENKGTLVGIFPKIKVKLGRLSDADMSAIINLSMQASADVQYYDVGKQAMVESSFYFGDVVDQIAKKSSMSHTGPEFSIISNKARE